MASPIRIQSLLKLAALCVSVSLGACTQHHALKSPTNPSEKFYGNILEQGEVVAHELPAMTGYRADLDCSPSHFEHAPVHYRVDRLLKTKANPVIDPRDRERHFNGDLTLSPGDMLELFIENGEGFNGRYILNAQGNVNIPYLKAINLLGLDVYQAAEKIEMALIKAEMFQPATISTSVQVLEWAEIDVVVTGAVFEPGRKRINQKFKERHINEKMAAYGDYSSTRFLSEALRAASGVRPDAKLDQVILIRNGWQVEVDMSGILSGDQVNDIPLIAGDQVVVPTTGCFQRHLVRPSQITPKGFRVFMSNLIDSAMSNSNAAVGRYATSLPYGSRLLQAAVSANCVGGKQWTNAPRKIVLASTNPITGQYQVVERSVEELMRQAHNEVQNPYLMPNDAVACYDSDVTNLRDVANFVMDILNPIRAL